MTLEQVVKQYEGNNFISARAWVDHPDFSGLYVRVRKRLINDGMVKVIDIASIQAKEPGQGAFTSLLNTLRINYSSYGIYVENVHNRRFGKKLLRMGFDEVDISTGNNFFMKGGC